MSRDFKRYGRHNNSKIKIVFFTKAPIGKERVRVLESLLKNNEIEIKAVIVEEVIHLPLIKFVSRIIKRIFKGGLRIYDIIRWSLRYFNQIFFNYGKQSISKNPLESLLNKNDVPLLIVKNTESKEVLDLVKLLKVDLGVIYFHRILSKKLFSIPKMFTINLHLGILPKYAGGDPCFWALVDGSKEVGLTVYQVTKTADKGKIILIKKISIGNDHSSKSLTEKVTKLAPQALLEAILKIKNDNNPFISVDNGERLYRHAPSLFTKLKYIKFL